MLPLPDDFYRHRETSKTEATKTLQGDLELPGVLMGSDYPPNTVTYTTYERRICSKIDWSAAAPRGKHVRTTEEAIGTPPAETTQHRIPGCG